MEILKSRRFWSAVIGLVMMVVVNLVPELAQHTETLTTAIMVVIGLLIGGYSIEDAISARK